jgi:hypothetical protein
MRRLPCQPRIRGGLLSLALLAGLPAAAAEAPPATLPVWQVLEFEQQAFFVTARSRIELVPDSADPAHRRLTATSSVASNSEEVVVKLAADGSASYRSRLGRGKGDEQRYKTYRFLPDHILRVRRDSPTESTEPPCRWPVSSRKEIPYPPAADGRVVTDAYALLELAGRFLAYPEATADVVVNTEFNFYLVHMTYSDGHPVKVNYQVTGGSARSDTRQTRGVVLAVSPLGEQLEKPDFSLLGLSGEITILFDAASMLPLQLRGTAPRIGPAEINLKTVTLREPPA